jgi:hypothetical protein
LLVITFSLVSFRSFVPFLVEKRLGDDVSLGGPVPEVQQAAALAAKREIRMNLGIHRLAANGAVMFHGGNDAAFD